MIFEQELICGTNIKKPVKKTHFINFELNYIFCYYAYYTFKVNGHLIVIKQ